MITEIRKREEMIPGETTIRIKTYHKTSALFKVAFCTFSTYFIFQLEEIVTCEISVCLYEVSARNICKFFLGHLNVMPYK